MRGVIRATAFALLAGSLLAGCSHAVKRDPQTLVVLEPDDANTINPLYANNEASFLYYTLVLDPLANNGPNFSMIPWLATSWKATPDELHWNVQLRRGVLWSDGAPFTSRDVVWTWRAMLDPKTGFPYLGNFAYVKRVVALGPYAVRFDLNAPTAEFVSGALNAPIMPEHVLAKTPDAQQRLTSFGQHPIGTGPYELASWSHDSEAVFVRNPRFWHGVAKIPRIDIRIVLDANARDQAMQNGSADLYDNVGSDSYRSLRKSAPWLKWLHLPDLYTDFISVNLRVPGLNDLALRRAMMYGWDRKALVAGLLHGDAMMATSIVPYATKYWYDANVMRYPYEPAMARRLLDAAGWKMDRDGVRAKDGTRLEFELQQPNGGTTDEGAEFQADMKAIGIRIDMKVLDYATFIDNQNLMHYQLSLTGWGGVVDPDEYTFLDSSQIEPVGNNDTAFSNPALDRALRAGRVTVDQAKRKPYYDTMQRITAAQLPVLWGWYTYYRAAYTPRLHFGSVAPQPDLYLWNDVWDWSLDP